MARNPGLDMVIHGWLAKDPEFRTLPSGNALTTWSIALKYQNKKTGEDLTKWFNCKAFDVLAEYVAENFRARSFISCKVHYLALWKDKTGAIREEYVISSLITEERDVPIDPAGGDTDGPPI